jgi:hypothetical protein
VARHRLDRRRVGEINCSSLELISARPGDEVHTQLKLRGGKPMLPLVRQPKSANCGPDCTRSELPESRPLGKGEVSALGTSDVVSSFARALTVLVGMSLLSSCFGKATYHWKEEVQLRDGRVIVIERSVRTGEVPVEIGQLPGESEYTLTFKTRDGKFVTWEAGRSFRPMILDFSGEIPYVVATGITLTDYQANGCPKPPYFIFRFEAGGWVRIAYEQLPSSVRRANLYSSPTRKDRVDAVRSGLVTLEDVRTSQLGLSAWRVQVAEDAPNPCADWDNDMMYGIKK